METPNRIGRLAGVVDGRVEFVALADGVTATIIDGHIRGGIDSTFFGSSTIRIKCQIASCSSISLGSAAYDLSSKRMAVIYHHGGHSKREVILPGTLERSIVLEIPLLAGGEIRGCDLDDRTVEKVRDHFHDDPRVQQYPLSAIMEDCVGAVLSPWARPSTLEKFKRAKLDELVALALELLLRPFELECPCLVTAREARKMAAVRDLLLTRLSTPPSLAELSRLAGMNRTRLNACFREVYGLSPFRFLKRERMRLALRSLQGSDMSLEEISDLCGYGHVSNFSLAYKAYTGASPSRHRGLSEIDLARIRLDP